jgi:hypothetical protein
MPTKGSVHQLITSLVLLLIDQRGPQRQELAAVLQLPPSSLTHSLGGSRKRSWRCHEVVLLAEYYGISTEALLRDGPERERLLLELAADLVERA